jgi:microcystin-dependent protein
VSTIRENFISGTLTVEITDVDTTITSPALAYLPEVVAPDVALVTLDPFGQRGRPEIVKVTAHAASATTATVVRAQEGTAARAHVVGTLWTHGAVASEWTALESSVADVIAVPGSTVFTDVAVSITPTSGNTEGSSDALARADHTHNVDTDVPGASAPGDAAAEGVSAKYARADHVHERESFADIQAGLFPVGMTMPWFGDVGTVPSGWLPLDGRTLVKADYLDLWNVVGYAYGGGGLSFKLPDTRGRALISLDDMGTPAGAAARVSSADALGDSGGEETTALLEAHLAAHSHVVPAHTHPIGNHSHTIPAHTHGPGTLATDTNTHTHKMTNDPLLSLEVVYGGEFGMPPGYAINTRSNQTVADSHSHAITAGATASGGNGVTGTSGGNTGSSDPVTSELTPPIPATPHNTMQPWIGCLWIIYTGV